MGGRKHLLTEDAAGKVTKIPLDPKNMEKQIKEEAARGRKAFVVDDDDLIRFGTMKRR